MKLRKHFLLVNCIVGLTVYILIGAIIFVKLEKTDEPNLVVANRILKTVQANLFLKFGVNITDKEYKDVVKNITEAVEFQGRHDWTYWKAVDFVIVSLTTIGYGDQVPRTRIGQIVFIIYSLIGLPLTMVTLKFTGNFLNDGYRMCIIQIDKTIFHKQEHSHLEIKCFFISFIAFIGLHLLGTLLLHFLDQVSFVEGLYATFVTLSTIGFGDYHFNLGLMMKYFGPVGATAALVLNLPFFLFSLTILSSFLQLAMDMVGKIRNRATIRANEDNNHLGEEGNLVEPNGQSDTPEQLGTKPVILSQDSIAENPSHHNA